MGSVIPLKKSVNSAYLDLKSLLNGKLDSVEKLIDLNRNKPIIVIDKKYFRPAEVNVLKGDYTRAKKILKWKPKIKVHQLISEMIKEEKKLQQSY